MEPEVKIQLLKFCFYIVNAIFLVRRRGRVNASLFVFTLGAGMFLIVMELSLSPAVEGRSDVSLQTQTQQEKNEGTISPIFIGFVLAGS